jgi:hypothetical protein
VLLQEPAADDHLPDLRGAFADQEHGGVAVEALDLVFRALVAHLVQLAGNGEPRAERSRSLAAGRISLSTNSRTERGFQ